MVDTEAGTTGPRLIEPGEFDEVLALVDRCFNHSPGGMRESNPHVYDPDHPERHAVICRNGEIVSHVACIPTTFVIDDRSVAAWGVSGVATDPRHTGNGNMDELVSFWLDRMDDANVALSQLWGDRVRYGRYGWETAGREYGYRITSRSFSDRPEPDGFVKRYDGRDSNLSLIRALHADERHRVARDEQRHRAVLGQRGLETLLYTEDSHEAYLSFGSSGRERTVKEIGGDPRGVRVLLSHLFRAYFTSEVTVFVRPHDPRTEMLTELSVDWTTYTTKKFNIRRLAPVLDAFAGQMARRWSQSGCNEGADGDLTLRIDDEAGARLSWTSDSVAVETLDGDADADIVLDRREMARLLFGFDGQRRTLDVDESFLEAVLPLDFHVPRSEWV